MQQQLDFARVNIREEAGRKIARQYRVRAVPTFLVISPSGKVLYRQVGGRPNRAEIEKKLAANALK